ncbi:Poly [ADP-ribose] polymerase [Actinidia chinensis var. chinensis]|uniref:Poly [ADP-ribose] polymerase n=1 Tax=Actinidia chinensis var. chinensis TaxID=1590841 RepID=A0A2R6PEQ2_ACTCC|nr:Poly [ADP-ribose] polymerase [Actinidia chinensis var. chinensis]
MKQGLMLTQPVTKRKWRRESRRHQVPRRPKKAKSEDEANGGKSIGDVAMEFDKFCKATIEYLSIEQMREILEANNLNASGSDDAVIPQCQDILFYGPLDECSICGGTLKRTGTKYYCKGNYSEWSTCTFNTKDPPRKGEPIKIPESVHKSPVGNMIKNRRQHSKKDAGPTDKPFAGMQYWKSKIERYGESFKFC